MLPSIGRRSLVISVSTGAKFPERYGFGDGRRAGNDRGGRRCRRRTARGEPSARPASGEQRRQAHAPPMSIVRLEMPFESAMVTTPSGDLRVEHMWPSLLG